MTTIKPVQSGSFEVSSTSSLNLSKIGKVTGTAPGKSMTPGPPTERRWEVPVANLPALVRSEIAKHPLLAGRDSVLVDYPIGKQGISAIGFMNNVVGGKIPDSVKPFFDPSRQIGASERSYVISALARAGMPEVAQHVATGGHPSELARGTNAPEKDCRQLVGADTKSVAPQSSADQRAQAAQSMLAARSRR